uniref:Uncharacterized protein n=1 Tax=Anopheles dirus TaxID=7168 RepID=A0A182NCR1_9DIPT
MEENRASPACVTLPALSAATRAAGETTGARAVPYLACLLMTLRGGFTAESTYASCVLRIGAAACSCESFMFCHVAVLDEVRIEVLEMQQLIRIGPFQHRLQDVERYSARRPDLVQVILQQPYAQLVQRRYDALRVRLHARVHLRADVLRLHALTEGFFLGERPATLPDPTALSSALPTPAPPPPPDDRFFDPDGIPIMASASAKLAPPEQSKPPVTSSVPESS